MKRGGKLTGHAQLMWRLCESEGGWCQVLGFWGEDRRHEIIGSRSSWEKEARVERERKSWEWGKHWAMPRKEWRGSRREAEKREKLGRTNEKEHARSTWEKRRWENGPSAGASWAQVKVGLESWSFFSLLSSPSWSTLRACSFRG